mmetsp:Transcript_73652/g.159357  ORF Transcript_73652/g.159357 Transcript_73652/m.159357 type:complete len:780 (-) Transcript_73652:189-2528(-)
MSAQSGQGRTRAKSIGHYILGKTIGEGTFGKVKLGTHILTGERVAVKVLEKERIVEVADVERVAREVHILKLIRHPHIVQLYEIIETRRQLYLIMEYASGGELFDYIVANGRVQEAEASRFFHQIIAGVEKIHAMHIVHRDLKPENLLLDEHRSIKIVDFGLSNVFRDEQLLKTACGSPCYAAPEMIAGHSYVPSLCDLWSCGVILFALVCGYLPFEDQQTAELYKKILAASYRPPKFISEAVKDLIAGLLTTDPSRRFTIPVIRSHPWYRQIAESSTPPADLSPGQMGLEEDVLRELDAFGFPRDYAVKCLEMNKHNHVTTTYYLLAEKKRRMLDTLDRLMPEDRVPGFGREALVGHSQGQEVHELRLEDVPQTRMAEINSSHPEGHHHAQHHNGFAAFDAPLPVPSQVPPSSPRPESPYGRNVPGRPVGTYDHIGIPPVRGVSPRSPTTYNQPTSSPQWTPRESGEPARYTPTGRQLPRPASPPGRSPLPHHSPSPVHVPAKTTPHGREATNGVTPSNDTPRRRSPTPYLGPPVAVRGSSGASSQPVGGGGSGPSGGHHSTAGAAGAVAAGTGPAVGSQGMSSAGQQPSHEFGSQQSSGHSENQVPSRSNTPPGGQYSRSPGPLPQRIYGKAGTTSVSATARTGSGSISARCTRPPTSPRDIGSTESAARRRVPTTMEAPQSARARLGGRVPVPTTTTTPRSTATAGGALSARGERPIAGRDVSRGLSVGGRGAPGVPGSAASQSGTGPAPTTSRVAWNAWGGGSTGRPGASRIASR